MAVRDACARQALRRAESSSAGDGRNVREVELERWEAVRAQMAPLRLLILSESHVWTREAELAATVPLEVFGHPAVPTEFARLVYCLGYGERNLVQGRVQGNFGSPQVWKLLAAGLDPDLGSQVVERTEPDLLRRMSAKLQLLERLKARGVWLLDACPVALYAASEPKPRMAVLAQAMELAWPVYTREAVRAAAPRAVMIVGKMVHDGIGGRIRAMLGPNVPVQWMYQPQARRPAVEHRAGIERLRGMVGRRER